MAVFYSFGTPGTGIYAGEYLEADLVAISNWFQWLVKNSPYEARAIMIYLARRDELNARIKTIEQLFEKAGLGRMLVNNDAVWSEGVAAAYDRATKPEESTVIWKEYTEGLPPAEIKLPRHTAIKMMEDARKWATESEEAEKEVWEIIISSSTNARVEGEW